MPIIELMFLFSLFPAIFLNEQMKNEIYHEHFLSTFDRYNKQTDHWLGEAGVSFFIRNVQANEIKTFLFFLHVFSRLKEWKEKENNKKKKEKGEKRKKNCS